MNLALERIRKQHPDQSGINMVDLMMWLVIAALLLAAAIQGIGYYQKAATVNTMENDALGAGTVALAHMSNVGVLNDSVLTEAKKETKASAGNVITSGDFDGRKYLRISNPSVTDRDALYLFSPEGSLSAGVHLVPKGGLPDGTVPTPPSPTVFSGWGESGSALGLSASQAVWNPTDGDPTGVLKDKNITDISSVGSATCAIADNAAYCWGTNASGQLGNGTTVSSTHPTPVTATNLAGKTLTAIEVDYQFACVLADGVPYCWGDNSAGQLGDGTAAMKTVPTAVTTSGVLSGKKLTSLTSSVFAMCGIASDGAYCWGQWTEENGTMNVMHTTPVKHGVTGTLAGKTVTDIFADSYGGCAVADGKVHCWGGSSGTVGNGTYTATTSAVAVVGDINTKTVTTLSSRSGSVCAIASGQVYCWGSNNQDSLGLNPSAPRTSTPTLLKGLEGKTVTYLSKSNYNGHVIADNQIYSWGFGAYGQLGQGTSTTNSATPVKPALSPATAGKTPVLITRGPVVLFK